MSEESNSVEVSRRIAAPAPLIFGILADPSRHAEFDGSDMLRGSDLDGPIEAVGDTFSMKMHRLGRDYLMINHIVEFEPASRITWAPAPGDVETAGGDPSRIGVPSGYRWGFLLTPDGEDATIVTEVFDYSAIVDLVREGDSWINGRTSVRESMEATLGRLDRICTG